MTIDECLHREVRWQPTGDDRNPWRAEVDGQNWVIQRTLMPDEGFFYGLIVDGTLLLFHMREENWPKNWIRPD